METNPALRQDWGAALGQETGTFGCPFLFQRNTTSVTGGGGSGSPGLTAIGRIGILTTLPLG